MSNQTKIKELTLKLLDAEKRCDMWMDVNKLAFKEIEKLEQAKVAFIDFVTNLPDYEAGTVLSIRDYLLTKYKGEN